ncbi:MAG: hypothetical protein AB9888_13365 [Bacteroidales bacterium]
MKSLSHEKIEFMSSLLTDKPIARKPNNIGLFEYIVVLILILYVGNANRLVLFTSFTEQPLVFFIPVLLAGILVLKHSVYFNRNFVLLIFFYLFYLIAITIKYKTFYPSFLVHYPSIFFIAYALIKSLKYDLFRVYEHLLFLLSVVGIFMWIIQFVLGGDTLFGLLSNFPNIHEFSHVTGGGINIILYSVQPTSFSSLYGHLPPRNCGFAWEPGGFAVYLCLAIFINLFLSKDEKNRRSRLIVLLLALLTTQSTTGFIILILIAAFYYFNTNLKTVFLVLPLLVIGIVFIFSLPFMTEKIVRLVTDISNVDAIVAAGYGREQSVTPQRFTSFAIAVKDFFLNPILGTGGISGESWTSKIGVNISTITGIGNLLAHFGIVGFLFFIITTYRTSVLFSKHFNYNGKPLLFLVVLSISISYGILFFPLITSFWIFGLFHSDKPPT